MYIATLKPSLPNLNSENDNSVLSNKKVDEIIKLEDLLKHQTSQKLSTKPGIEFQKFKNTLNDLSRIAGLKKKNKNINKIPKFIIKKNVQDPVKLTPNLKTNDKPFRKKIIIKPKNIKKIKKVKPKNNNKKINNEWLKIEKLVN